jgi:DNA-binding protein H-NS
MTDPITQHEQLKQKQQQIADQLQQLEQDEAYKKAVAFKQDIKDVLAKHDKTEDELLQLFGHAAPKNTRKTPRQKAGKSQPLKRYTNPHTGDVVEARSLRKPKLQAWKKEHGEATVKSWAVNIDDTGPASTTP